MIAMSPFRVFILEEMRERGLELRELPAELRNYIAYVQPFDDDIAWLLADVFSTSVEYWKSLHRRTEYV